jgi:Fe-S-cluster containining protein
MLAEAGDFECLKCGECCRTILRSDEGGFKRGLLLTEKEIHLFPKEAVSPKLAIGLTEPKTVVLYQLNVNPCPHLSSRNECQRYSERPLMCRSFPIIAGAVSNRCKVFRYRKVGVSYNEPYTMVEQLEASDKINKYIENCIKKHYKKGLRLWEYDLAAEKWVDKGQYDKM